MPALSCTRRLITGNKTSFEPIDLKINIDTHTHTRTYRATLPAINTVAREWKRAAAEAEDTSGPKTAASTTSYSFTHWVIDIQTHSLTHSLTHIHTQARELSRRQPPNETIKRNIKQPSLALQVSERERRERETRHKEMQRGWGRAVQPEATIEQCRQSGDFDADGQAKHKQSVEPKQQQQHEQRQQ